MGQALAKEHEVGSHVASGGPGGAWRVFGAKRLPSREEVALWVFEKREGGREAFTELMRKEALMLKKLRHPGIISVHKVEETRTSLVIETEPVVCSLADALRRDARSFDEFDVKTGLLQVCEALVFLHSRCETALLSLSPEVVWVTRRGSWKLGGGFAFAQAMKGPGFGPPTAFAADALATLGTQQSLAPALEYAAPEAVLQKRFSEKSDIFSLGCLLYDLQQTQSHRRLRPVRSLAEYQAQLILLMNAVNGRPSVGEGPSVDGFPQLLLEILQALLAHDEGRRPTAASFLSGSFFNDVLLRTVVFVSSLVDKNEAEKGAFLKGLPQVLPQFPATVVTNRITPALLAELSPTTAPALLPLLLNCILQCERNKGTCSETTLNAMAKANVFTSTDNVVAAALLGGLDLLLGSGPEPATIHIVPILCRNIEGALQSPRLADSTFKAIAKSAGLIPTAALRSQLLPRIFEVVCTEQLPVLVRANGMVCVNKLIPLLDAGSAVEFILPLLEMLMSRPDTIKTLQLLMAIVWGYDALGRKAGGTLIMSRILPTLAPVVICAPLDLTQYTTVMQVIGELFSRADADLKKEYERRMAKPAEMAAPVTTQEPQQDFMSLVSKAYTTKTAVSGKPAAPVAAPPSAVMSDLSSLDSSLPYSTAIMQPTVIPSSSSSTSLPSSPPAFAASTSAAPLSWLMNTPIAPSSPSFSHNSSAPAASPTLAAPMMTPSNPPPRSLGHMASGSDPFGAGDSTSFSSLITQAKLDAVAPPPGARPAMSPVASAADDIFAALSAPVPSPTPPPQPQPVPIHSAYAPPTPSSPVVPQHSFMQPQPAAYGQSAMISNQFSPLVAKPTPVMAPAPVSAPTPTAWKPSADVFDDDFFDPRKK